MSNLSAREISMSHTIDDLATALGKLRRCVVQQLDLLDVVPHAIAHARFAVAEEYVGRATDALRSALDASVDGPEHTCTSQCDRCHTPAHCVQAVTRVGDLLLCATCARNPDRR